MQNQRRLHELIDTLHLTSLNDATLITITKKNVYKVLILSFVGAGGWIESLLGRARLDVFPVSSLVLTTICFNLILNDTK